MEPLTRQQFVDTYVGKKKRVYQRAKEQLEGEEVSLRKFARIKCFIKSEAIKEDPRLISTRDPRFHMEFGRHIKVIEKGVFDDINHLFATKRKFVEKLPTVLKGLNQQERGRVIKAKWDRFTNPVFVGLDVSRFDAHVSRELLEVEAEVYKNRTTGNDSPFSFIQLMKATMENHGKYSGKDGSIAYRIAGTRASGDMNTSLGNCTVMSALLYSYLLSKSLLGDVEVIDDGDDAGIIMERETYEKLRDIGSWYKTMGFTLKVEDPVGSIEEVEFCRCHPIYTPVGYTMCPNPYRRLYTDAITDTPLLNLTTWRKWTGAVAGSGLATTAGLPIFQEYYRWFERSSGLAWKAQEGSFYHKYRDHLSERLKIQRRPVHPATRDSFARAYGVSPSKQIFLEQLMKSQALLQYSSRKLTVLTSSFLQTELPYSVTSVYESSIGE